MIVAIDAGNTRSKWKAWGDGGVLGQGAFAHHDGMPSSLEALLEGDKDNCRVFVASVADPAVESRLRVLFDGCQFVAVQSRKQCLGVTSRYAVPENLGVDRWLAMIEAWHCGGGAACCVIDLGTAATLDIVDDKGFHVGGYIVPGVSLMKNSLGRSTERVHFSADAPLSVDYGIDTTTAVNNGVHGLVTAWLKHEIGRFHDVYEGGRVYLTGGDSQRFLPLLADNHVMHYPDLVLDALLRLSY